MGYEGSCPPWDGRGLSFMGYGGVLFSMGFGGSRLRWHGSYTGLEMIIAREGIPLGYYLG